MALLDDLSKIAVPAVSILGAAFDKESNHVKIMKKALIGKSSANLIWQVVNYLKSAIILIILGVAAISYYNLPAATYVLLLILILANAMGTILNYLRIKALEAISDENTGKNFKALVVTDNYYGIITASVMLVVNILAVAFIFLLFGGTISELIAKSPAAVIIEYALFIGVVFYLFDMVLAYMKYTLLKRMDESRNVAQLAQDKLMLDQKLKLVKNAPSAALIILILFYMSSLPGGPPWWVPFVFGGFILLAMAGSYVQISRIEKVDLSVKELPKPEAIKITKESPKDEKVLGSVSGLLNAATTGVAVMGVGKMTDTENALIITTHRLMFIEVPVAGGGNIVGKTNYLYQNIYFNKQEIKTKCDEIVKTMNPQQILNSDLLRKELPYDGIKKAELKSNLIVLETTDGKKYRYHSSIKEDIDLVKLLLKDYLTGRIEISDSWL